MTQKRLAIFLPSLAGGGAEKSMLRLASGLARRGYALDLVLARAEGPARAPAIARATRRPPPRSTRTPMMPANPRQPADD